ncbi:MAG: uroporphyrinogen-III synthase [Kofleriaceae bacterium]
MAYAVVTRELDSTSAYVTVLATRGLDVIAMPVTRTEPPRDATALARALESQYAAIVIASVRGAAALVAARGAQPLPEVWAVGPATQRALQAAGISARTAQSASDAAALAHALIATREIAGQRVLVPRAEGGRDDAIEILRAAGAEVVDVIAYRTVPAPADDPAVVAGHDALVLGRADVCVVFAPSQVRALEGLVGPLVRLNVVWVAIGDTTGAVLREAGIDEVSIATTPTPEGVANAVAAVYLREPEPT